MKTLSLSVELSTLAMENTSHPLAPAEFLGKVKNVLSRRPDILGNFTGSRLNTNKHLGDDLLLNEYQLDYEKSSLHFQLLNFGPRGDWQVKGFRFV